MKSFPLPQRCAHFFDLAKSIQGFGNGRKRISASLLFKFEWHSPNEQCIFSKMRDNIFLYFFPCRCFVIKARVDLNPPGDQLNKLLTEQLQQLQMQQPRRKNFPYKVQLLLKFKLKPIVVAYCAFRASPVASYITIY